MMVKTKLIVNGGYIYIYISLIKWGIHEEHPLPRIDKLIDATMGHDLMSFLYAFSRCH